MAKRIAELARRQEIEQRYTEEFVQEMAPNLTVYLLPIREVVNDPVFPGELLLGVTYTLQREPHSSWHRTARIFERKIQEEEVTIVELSCSTERMKMIWTFDYDDALCQAADFLQAALVSEGFVYVPKKIPSAWYAEQANQHLEQDG
jgi:hypothetical protein